MHPLIRAQACAAFACLLATAATAADDENLDAQIQTKQAGVKLTLVAEHPQVATPTGIDVDEDGGVWVVSSHTHFRPDDYDGPKYDEVVVLGPDGRRVFYNQTTATMDLELGDEGWVYLAERSRLIRVRDSDGDGVGDQEQNLAVLNSTADYPHNGLAGLAWTPQGELIFALGENYATDWKLTGADQATIEGSGEGGVFQIQPDGKQLKRLARGFWNPFGICVRDDGEIFAAENDPGARPPCRLLHVVEGGDYGYQRHFGPAPFHPFVCWNGELPGTLPMVAALGEAPCGIVPLGGGLLVTSWADHRIDYYPLRDEGASFKADRVRVVTGGDVFRPTCIAAGAPGAFYVADWTIGSYELHGKGRVWKLELDTSQDWIAKPSSPSKSRKAARALRNPDLGAHYSRGVLLQAAEDSDPFLAQAAQLALSRQPEAISLGNYRSLPRDQKLLAVRVAKARFAALADRRAIDSKDRYLAEYYWVDDLIGRQAPEIRFEGLRWAAERRMSRVAREVGRVLKQPKIDFTLFEAALAAANAIEGKGQLGVADPKMLMARVVDGSSQPQLRAFALRLVDPSHPRLTAELLEQLATQEDRSLAREAVRTLASHPVPKSRDVLERLCLKQGCPEELRVEALVGLAVAPNEHWACLSQLADSPNRAVREEALRSLRQAKHADKAELLAGLAKRHPQSADLIAAAADPAALAAGRPPADDLAAWRQRLAAVQTPPDPAAGRRIFFHSTVGMCANCHRHRGRGNVVGPDLSGVAQRDQADMLLRAVLQPSRDVAPQYHAWKLLTDDGVTFTGIMLRKGGRSGKEVYRDNQGRERAFLKTDISRRQEVTTSLMPDNLAHQMTDRELRDLLAFLTTKQR